MSLVVIQGREPLCLQVSVRKPSAFGSSEQALARNVQGLANMGGFGRALHNFSLQRTVRLRRPSAELSR